jgi:UDP-glucose 4-epimerase
MLSQAMRRLKRPTVPMPGFAVGQAGSFLRQARLADFSPEQLGFLTYGRGVDTTRMREELGFVPSMTTEEAFAEFAQSLTPTGGHTERLLGVLAESLPSTHALQRSTGAVDG